TSVLTLSPPSSFWRRLAPRKPTRLSPAEPPHELRPDLVIAGRVVAGRVVVAHQDAVRVDAGPDVEEVDETAPPVPGDRQDRPAVDRFLRDLDIRQAGRLREVLVPHFRDELPGPRVVPNVQRVPEPEQAPLQFCRVDLVAADRGPEVFPRRPECPVRGALRVTKRFVVRGQGDRDGDI